MKITINMSQLALANASLVATGRQIDGALRRAVRATATDIRREMLVEPIMASTGLKRKILNDRLMLRFDRGPATKNSVEFAGGEHSARIVPSAKGIRVTEFKGWRTDAIDKTRARILVPWVVGGMKVAAGFVNPSGKKQKPIRTRSRKKALPFARTALAPSVASMLKALYNDRFIGDASDRLAERFELEISKELNK